ncbi:extracellular solute-binding protein [Natranaerobius thermophilus]|uniref:Extracellular solute-binding protein family 1 n=1 Tax=Natranaerobius thermophilus (strain ATCC BAA-1301 / DSM 18059 / JW/NM-WN-LF) TaxID=457570 RepID=B2A3K8_NATTJ|nr:extracellular solute-binding protein [Natranaerobius thermophilus]ACB86437.1 extracellular solute-binding protein family 1 [Natranaerobius thermophilus JW/NM-WN-LF]
MNKLVAKIEKTTLTLLIIVLLSGVFMLTGCGSGGEQADELVVYSARNERFVNELLDKFTEDTGIEVKALHGADPQQIEEEANNVQADIFISNDLGALGYLDEQGLLQGSEPEGIESIPENFRAENNAFFAISLRSRGFIYNKDMISEEDMPSSGEDLFDSKWADVEGGYAITRGGNGGMIGHVSALRHEWGDDKTSEWIAAIREHAGGIYEGHSDVRRAVGAGEHAFGLVNNYYFHQQLMEPQDNNVGFIYLDQGQDEMGTVANAAGVGLVKGAPHQENAETFLDWLLEEENQAKFVGESLELLINSEYGDKVEYPSEVEPHIVDTDELKIQEMPVKELGNYYQDTTELIEESGLDLELR